MYLYIPLEFMSLDIPSLPAVVIVKRGDEAVTGAFHWLHEKDETERKAPVRGSAQDNPPRLRLLGTR